MTPEKRLTELGLELKAHPLPLGPLEAVVIDGHLAWVSGQPPSRDGKLVYTGQLIGEESLEDGRAAARLCALNILAAAREKLGSLDRVARVIKIVGFVQSPPGFKIQSKIIDAASELLVDVFGDNGSHARSAIGVASLPGDMSVEIEAVLSLHEGAE